MNEVDSGDSLSEKDIPIHNYINIVIEIFVNVHFCTVFSKVLMAAVIGENGLRNTDFSDWIRAYYGALRSRPI